MRGLDDGMRGAVVVIVIFLGLFAFAEVIGLSKTTILVDTIRFLRDASPI